MLFTSRFIKSRFRLAATILLWSSFKNNGATAFKIRIDGREADGGGYINNLILCSKLENEYPNVANAVFGVQGVGTACTQRGGYDNWVLEELEAITSPHSYFAIQSYTGEYIIHEPLAPGNDFFTMSSGLPGANESGRNYVKSEFWIGRGGNLQLINEYNPIQDGDYIIFAGPGPQEPHTRFHVMRSPTAQGLPAQDYKYPLYALLPEDTVTIPREADIRVQGLRIKLSGQSGELVLGPLSPELLVKQPQAQPNPQDQINLFFNQDWRQALRKDDSGDAQGFYSGSDPEALSWGPNVDSPTPNQILEDTGTGGFYADNDNTQLNWEPTVNNPSISQNLPLEDLRIHRTAAVGRRAGGPNRNSAATNGMASLLGLPTMNNQQPQDGLVPGERSRIPGEIGPPNSGIGAWDESNVFDIGGNQYYMRPPEVGPDGRVIEFTPIIIGKSFNHMLRMHDPFPALSRQKGSRFNDEPLGDFPDYDPAAFELPDLGTISSEDILDNNPVRDTTGNNQVSAGSPTYYRIPRWQPRPISEESDEDSSVSSASLPTGDIRRNGDGFSGSDTGSSAEQGEIANNRAIDEIESDGDQYYPAAVYLDENEEAAYFPDDIEEFQSPVALDSGSLGIPGSLFGPSSNSQDITSPYPFGANQSPPAGQQSETIPASQRSGDQGGNSVYPEEGRSNRAAPNYNERMLEKIEEEGSSESEAKIDEPGTSRWGMQIEDSGSNSAFSPDIPWGEQIGQSDAENEIGLGPGGMYGEEQTGQGFPEIGIGEEEIEEGIMENTILPRSDDIYNGDDGSLDEVQAMPGDDEWDSNDRSYDSLLTDWDENGLDTIPYSKMKGAREMQDFLLPASFDIGLPPKKAGWWQRVKNKISRKPNQQSKPSEPTGFEQSDW
ncbi:hypothetical protein TWF730_002046 [Orbilia blumenaviensis]|uniref:Uncharacterized protein n=1 Tax=Orbilia blumenaviensis TaxID=1796055 RepID=A0AAV9UGA3_9PEZI